MNKVIITCCLLMSALASGANAQSYAGKPAGINRTVELTLGREKLGKVPTVEVIAGGKTRSFYFDSGGGISPELAKEIGCVPFGGQIGYNAGG